MDLNERNQVYLGGWYLWESTKGVSWALEEVCTLPVKSVVNDLLEPMQRRTKQVLFVQLLTFISSHLGRNVLWVWYVFITIIVFTCEGDSVFAGFLLIVGWLVCQHHYKKTAGWISMKLGWTTGLGPERNPSEFRIKGRIQEFFIRLISLWENSHSVVLCLSH